MEFAQPVKSMEGEIKSPGVQTGANTWIQKDLQKSGLSIENFTIEPLKREAELRERLGFASILRIPIATVGGYWISYPNVPDYFRLKLKNKIGDAKYLSRKGGGNHPYILPQLEETLNKYTPDKSVFITEGEKKAAKATLEGFPCIGLSGVFNFKEKGIDFLPELDKCNWKDKNVFIVFDSDITEKAGVRLAEHRLANELTKRGAKVFALRLPEQTNGDKNGLDDYLFRYGAEAFKELIKEARPTLELHCENDTSSVKSVEIEYPPPLDEVALYGLAGEIIKAIEAHSEADPIALLMNFLTVFGNVIGCGSWFMVGAEKHHLKLFCTFAGESSKARKGTSWAPIRNLFEIVDPDWAESRIQTGLSSGEGVIFHVRDPIYKEELDKKTGAVNEVLADSGISDKRLFIMEGELAQALKVISREGNTLSPVVRNAWDSGNLQTLTKNSPIRATGAHISIIGHITKRELLRTLNETDTFNGLANRFLWFCVRRSKCLPFGGDFSRIDLDMLTKKLHEAVEFAKTAGEVKWAEATKPLWAEIYPELSEGNPGLIGAITARAEAQVTRLACVYALLDSKKEIQPSHLKAALALWSYAEASVRYIFQNLASNPQANKILEALVRRPQGMTRTDLNNLFGRNQSAARITEALQELLGTRLVKVRTFKTGGRPSERWILTQHENEKDETNEKRV